MFKEKLYDLVVDKLNLVAEENDLDLRFAGGYHIVMYQNGTPQAVFTSDESKFDYKKQTVIPVAEEISQETPSVNGSDRSDYVCQYQLMFRLKDLTNIKTALEEFRAYFFNNKHHVIDGYNVVFKVTRGSKQATYDMGAGNMLGRYKIDIYLTASKGYLIKDTDKWEIKKDGESEYQTLPLIEETAGINYTISPQTSETETTYTAENYNNTKDFNIYYDSSNFVSDLYKLIVEGGISEVYDLRHTFNGTAGEVQKVIISGASRTLAPNAPLLLKVQLSKYEE